MNMEERMLDRQAMKARRENAVTIPLKLIFTEKEDCYVFEVVYTDGKGLAVAYIKESANIDTPELKEATIDFLIEQLTDCSLNYGYKFETPITRDMIKL